MFLRSIFVFILSTTLAYAAETAVISPTTSAVTTTGTVFGVAANHCRRISASTALAGSETAGVEHTVDDGATWVNSGSGYELDTSYQFYNIKGPGQFRPIKDATAGSVGIYIGKEFRCEW